jgi:cytochrome c oxidase subunit 4
MDSSPQPIAAPATGAVRHAHPPYVAIWVGLALLTGLELTIAFLPWPKIAIILVLIALAVWKALLVALFFMHLRFERNRLRLLAIAPLPFCVILVATVLMEHFR